MLTSYPGIMISTLGFVLTAEGRENLPVKQGGRIASLREKPAKCVHRTEGSIIRYETLQTRVK